MEQDLSLMKQLLTLNETIEDLKWQRHYYYSAPGPHSLPGSSSAELDHSDCSVSDTEMYDSEDDTLLAVHHHHHTHTHTRTAAAATATNTAATTANTTTTAHTASTTCGGLKAPLVMLLSVPSYSSSQRRNHRQSGHVTAAGAAHAQCGVGSELLVPGPSVKVYHSEQNSFDSGIHDPSSGEEEAAV